MSLSSRRPLLAVYLTALSLIAASSSRATRMVWAADPAESPRVTVYDPNLNHLWNRLHEALYVRLERKGQDDPGELDPFLWEHSPYRPFPWERAPYREMQERYKRAIAVLDDFISEEGNKLIADSRKRALLQRDLWVLFDTAAQSRWLVSPDKVDSEIELARRAARIMSRLALTADQIKALPDNWSEAVAAGKLPDWFEAGRLWDADGPWVLLGSEDNVPLARTHVELFCGRSAFFVFLRLPGARKQTLKYLADLRSNGNAAKSAQGAMFALVRQMQLIDDHGRITLTPVIESLQIRGFGNQEFKLSRKDFTAGKPSLVAIGPEDRERDFLTLLRRNAGHGRGKVLATCTSCHDPGTMQSYVRHLPPAQFIKPSLRASNRDEEALRARVWKKDRYEWGLLQGLTLTRLREQTEGH